MTVQKGGWDHFNEGFDADEDAQRVQGLARDGAVVTSGGTYNAADIKGFLVVAVGAGDWTLVTKNGTTLAFTPTAAYIGREYSMHLTSITITASSEVVVYI